MDEISFGPDREPRRPSRGRRALIAALSVAGAAAVAAGVQHTLAVQRLASQSASQPAALPATPVRLPSKVCPPAHPGWPNLAGLPAGLRLGAMPVIIDAQFSGRCPTP
jgi:hypothetical protein